MFEMITGRSQCTHWASPLLSQFPLHLLCCLKQLLLPLLLQMLCYDWFILGKNILLILKCHVLLQFKLILSIILCMPSLLLLVLGWGRLIHLTLLWSLLCCECLIHMGPGYFHFWGICLLIIRSWIWDCSHILTILMQSLFFGFNWLLILLWDFWFDINIPFWVLWFVHVTWLFVLCWLGLLCALSDGWSLDRWLTKLKIILSSIRLLPIWLYLLWCWFWFWFRWRWLSEWEVFLFCVLSWLFLLFCFRFCCTESIFFISQIIG